LTEAFYLVSDATHIRSSIQSEIEERKYMSFHISQAERDRDDTGIRGYESKVDSHVGLLGWCDWSVAAVLRSLKS